MSIYDITSGTLPGSLLAGDVINCPYSGDYKTIILPAGQYKLEVWGGSGGRGGDGSGKPLTSNSNQGRGGYSIGTLNLEEITTLYLYAGGEGEGVISTTTNTRKGGFNGGGSGGAITSQSSYTPGTGGGGASDIRIESNSLYARVIVAGGGGGVSWISGASSTRNGGDGGGTSGVAANKGGSSSTPLICAQPGTLSNGGAGGAWTSGASGGNGIFGIGGNGTSNASSLINSGAGGGGGWYGGGGGPASGSGNQGHGAGGSGYIYTSYTSSSYPSGCLLNSSHYLTSAGTFAGNTSFVSPNGASEIGHTGNGYVRITVMYISNSTFFIWEDGMYKPFTIYEKIDNNWEKLKGREFIQKILLK